MLTRTCFPEITASDVNMKSVRRARSSSPKHMKSDVDLACLRRQFQSLKIDIDLKRIAAARQAELATDPEVLQDTSLGQPALPPGQILTQDLKQRRRRSRSVSSSRRQPKRADSSADSVASDFSSSGRGRALGFLQSAAQHQQERDAEAKAATLQRTAEYAGTRTEEGAQQRVTDRVRSIDSTSGTVAKAAAVATTLAYLPVAKGATNVTDTISQIPDYTWVSWATLYIGDAIQWLFLLIGILWTIHFIGGYILPHSWKTALRRAAIWFIAPGPPPGPYPEELSSSSQRELPDREPQTYTVVNRKTRETTKRESRSLSPPVLTETAGTSSDVAAWAQYQKSNEEISKNA